jgi:hypothetical protein
MRAILRSFLATMAIVGVALALEAQETRSSNLQIENGVERVGPIRHPGATKPSFTVTLSPGLRNKNLSEFRVGSKVWIAITQANTTNHTIDCSGLARNGIDTFYFYDVRDEDGNPAEKLVRPHMGLDAGQPTWCSILAGGSHLDEEQISRIYKFDRPGRYTIQVSRFDPEIKDDQGNPLKVLSNTITITITG